MKSFTLLSSLKPIDVQSFKIIVSPYNLRQDLHLFVRYVGDHQIKRSVRENLIPKAEAKRLARLLSDPDAIQEIEEDGYSAWLHVIDYLAHSLGLVDYKVTGTYQGYFSQHSSFQDNYMTLRTERHAEFMAKPLLAQERMLFQHLINRFGPGDNEFYTPSYFNLCDTFIINGYGVGVMPNLDFAAVRRFLCECLAQCAPGVWYDTTSLTEYLKRAHPYFLIPKNPQYKYKNKSGRYGNFREGITIWDSNTVVDESAPDAFERVEGRYVERFLAHIPLLLGYIELALGDPVNPGVYPNLGTVKGFKVSELFVRLMRGHIPDPKVTVHPNHEIHVEADFYPAALIEQFTPFADLIAVDKVCILTLKKTKAVEYLAGDASRDLKALLETASCRPLPPNIATELEEWAGHSDTFVLYENFGLLEGRKFHQAVQDHIEAVIGKDFRLIRQPESLFAKLEAAEQAPIMITHQRERLAPPPEEATSRLLTKSKPKKKPEKPELNIERRAWVTLTVPIMAALDALTRLLLNERCPVEVDPHKRTLTYPAAHQKAVTTALDSLKQTYRVNIEDMPL